MLHPKNTSTDTKIMPHMHTFYPSTILTMFWMFTTAWNGWYYNQGLLEREGLSTSWWRHRGEA